MPIDTKTGRWRPNTSAKQDKLRDMCRQYRFPLANGPRYSGKTIGCEHAFVEHGWNTVRGNDVIITVSQTVGLDSGIWKEFTELIIPEWIDGDFGLRWTRKPYTQGVSKKPACEITNRKVLELQEMGINPDALNDDELKEAGAVTTFQLESLKDENEAEARFKGRKYTGMYVPELTSFIRRETFDTWTECLRIKDPPPGTHLLFLADTNPPDSDSWWIHDLWWDLMETPDDDESISEFLRNTLPDPTPEKVSSLIESTRVLKQQLARMDITVKDNPFADPNHVKMLEAKYAHNDELYRRYILGECVQTTEGSIYAKVFREKIHVIGEVKTSGNKTPLIIMPQEDCMRLITGSDPGPSNFAFHIIEKIIPDKAMYPQYAGKPVFNVLEEIVLTEEDFDLREVTRLCVERMNFWKNKPIPRSKMEWMHWADRSVFDTKIPFTDKYWHAVVYELTNGEIDYTAADRGKGSVGLRIDLLYRLLFEERIFFNRNYTPVTIAMIKAIRRGKIPGSIARGSKHKHPFDSLTYPLASECGEELANDIMRQIQNMRRQRNASSVVSVPI